MLRPGAFAILLVFSSSVFAAELYNPNCDYKDIGDKCVSIDDGLFMIADARLNELFKKVSAMLKKLDNSDARANYYKPFLQSQRSWLRYRDGFCAFDSELHAYYISDTTPMEDNKSCMARVSDERSQQLLSILRKYKEQADSLDSDGNIFSGR